MSGEQNLQLIREIEANRDFLLMVYEQNPALLARADPRIQQLLEPLPAVVSARSDRSDQAFISCK